MKLLIWGIGQLALATVKNLSDSDIIGYIDTYSDVGMFAEKPVYKPVEVKEIKYDAILVSTIFGEEIKKICEEYDIPLSSVIFVYGNMQMMDMNQDYEFITNICGERFAQSVENRYHLVREIDTDLSKNKKDFEAVDYLDKKLYRSDYVRVKTLELLVDEIVRNNIRGEIAELGVFRGDFAQFLNLAFPTRKLYLFDTFEGFDRNELETELDGELMSVARDIYKNTSIQIVLNKMNYKKNVIVKQGYFPASLEGLEEKFAFVSLDCDWEESLYQGLVYFYPRLSEGGYIMIHDYNNHVGCAKKAIYRYERTVGKGLSKVPICDTQGSLILTK